MAAFSFDEYKKMMNTYVQNGNQKFDSTTSIDAIYWKLLYSSTAMNKKIANIPDTPEIETSLKRLSKSLYYMVNVLNVPMNINSGYRNDETNYAVTGKKNYTSQHGKGQAIDLRSQNATPKDTAKIFMFIINNENFKNKFDQIIWETQTQGRYWTHVSFVISNDDVQNDNSYDPRDKKSSTKMLWYTGKDGIDILWDKNKSKASAGRYINLRDGKFLRESNGLISFDGVSYLQDIKYDGNDFDINKNAKDTLDNYNTEATIDYSKVVEQYTAPTTKGSGQSNIVTKLASANTKYTEDKSTNNDARKKTFSSLAESLKNNSVTASETDVVISAEQYDVNILKGDQTSKDMIGIK